MSHQNNFFPHDYRLSASHRESLITEQLVTRASRQPNHAAEAAALRRLARALASSDTAMLDTLASEAARLCRAGSAGISVLESPPDRPASFRWAALAGHCAPLLNTHRPFDDSVCGVTLALGKPELFNRPQRYFPSIETLAPTVVEALLVPIPVGDGPWGAIWVMSHDENLLFDAEDLRLLGSLADFTGAAMHVSRMQALAERRALEAEEAQEALRRAQERTYEFIATLSHELRSPIAPVTSSLEILSRLAPKTSAAATRALDIGRRQMSRLQRLVDDLLDASRIRHGKVNVEMSACTLTDVVGDAVTAVQPAMDARGHHFVVRCPAEPISLHADGARLTQVLVNLLSNSAKYSPDGGHIELEIVVQPNTEPAVTSSGHLQITVTDNGYGIPEDKLPYVFGMFTQLDSRGSSAESGLGIGLALVKYLVESHRGTITVCGNGLQMGTTVTVRLPIVRELPNISSTTQRDEGRDPSFPVSSAPSAV
ncbi:Histidine kinase [Paraburkholderia sabiae]|uniref:sensor histidine kinase n=1 Tax=Paraburkholderia sabiae TaxID=273251 RepID=UPI001CAF1462|nr:GAF domain-containing sensor histidine kinase [Paraburkholderia sabiae]CAG9225780.1 Histidine kinase [Paraburkholderia sabiae]